MYGEEEFFADTTADGEQVHASFGSGDCQLRRLAGATVLLAAVGAVGGVIALTSISSPGSRRRGARSQADSRSPLPAGEQVVPMKTSPDTLTVPGQQRNGAPPQLGGRRQQARSRRLSAPLRRGPERIAVARTMVVADPRQVAQSLNGGVLASVAYSSTVTPAMALQPGQAEFGFER